MNRHKGRTAKFIEGVKQKSTALSSMSKHLGRLRGNHICLGITGLSQSGKSAFITSLINQLLHHDRAQLPGFSPVLSGRLLGVKMQPLEDKELAPFPYDAAYRNITGSPPKWPESTRNVSGCQLELLLAKSRNSFTPFSRENFSLYLEIRDYPGEWLLDLPMREMSYLDWCAQCNALYSQEPRKALLGELHGSLQQLDPFAEIDEGSLRDFNSQYIKFLHECKNAGLSLIQPGHFLLPGDVSDPTILCFIPLLNGSRYSQGQLAAATENSLFKVCERRYQAYLKNLVEPFYKNFFSRIDRQLVLVDTVNALCAGPAYMDDMCQAITNITDSFSFGSQNRLMQLFTPKIDKVVFAATKIDQVLSEDHENVRQLLASIVRNAYQKAQHEGVRPHCEASAAVRCSKEEVHEGDRGITGISRSGERVGYVHPTIPTRIPEEDMWQPFVHWQPETLMPPAGLSYKNGDPIPHIRIDSILDALLGDHSL